MTATRRLLATWLERKFSHWYACPAPEVEARVRREANHPETARQPLLFANPFRIADLGALDDAALGDVLGQGAPRVAPELLGRALRGQPPELTRRVAKVLAPAQVAAYERALGTPIMATRACAARRGLLDACFWELIYWRMPARYAELAEGERLHPGIFAHLAPSIRGRDVLDAGAGAGRATFAATDAARVIAVEPSGGLRRILSRAVADRGEAERVRVCAGTFAALPLPDASVDVALSCSAFTSEPAQGGERGLAELRRVTRPGGLVAVIWPRPQDYAWLAAHGFAYEAFAIPPGFGVRFRSLRRALRLAGLFYARNPAVTRYLRATQRGEVPYDVLGANPPHDYCWLRLPGGTR